MINHSGSLASFAPFRLHNISATAFEMKIKHVSFFSFFFLGAELTLAALSPFPSDFRVSTDNRSANWPIPRKRVPGERVAVVAGKGGQAGRRKTATLIPRLSDEGNLPPALVPEQWLRGFKFYNRPVRQTKNGYHTCVGCCLWLVSLSL